MPTTTPAPSESATHDRGTTCADDATGTPGGWWLTWLSRVAPPADVADNDAGPDGYGGYF